MSVSVLARSGRCAADATVNLVAGSVVGGLAAGTEAVGAVASAGLGVAALPVRVGARVATAEVSRPRLPRRRWCGDHRAWIEVRGLDGPDGTHRGRVVLDALRGRPGVTSVDLNRPLSRVVIGLGGDRPSLRQLCSVIDDAENRSGHTAHSEAAGTRTEPTRPGSLPGDGVALAARGAVVGVTAAGLGVAAVGRALRLPQAPVTVDAAMAIANYQPWVRRLLEDRIGTGATDTVLSLATTAAHVVTLSPATLSVNLTLQSLKVAEGRAEARAWARQEPVLARHADHPEVPTSSRSVPAPVGLVERHARRMAFVQGIGAGLVGVITRRADAASGAALAASPKAMRFTCESFAATLGRGLAHRHALLPLQPESLRRLDKIDALVIDPRLLCSQQLRIVRVRGADDAELSVAWDRAQHLLDKPDLTPGWQRVTGMPGRRSGRRIEALVLPAHHPLAAALVTEARGTGAEMATADVETLGELRPAFDDLLPVHDGAVDEVLAGAVADLQQAGHTVAVLSSTGVAALSSADVAVGIMPDADSAPPWNADLILADLAGAWQLLHALPAARQASRHGIAISSGASALAGLALVPGARGVRGPGPVTVGAVAGLLVGYLLARNVTRTPAPNPASAYEWHTMSVQHVREVLSHSVTGSESADGRRGGQPGTVRQFFSAVRSELSDPLTPVLAVGSAATAMLGSPIDAVMVGAVLTGNSILAAVQRLRAENRLNRLLAQQTPPARTIATGRDGADRYDEVLAEQLQPGDVIEVRSNEVVPADARVIDVVEAEVDESSLTGESLSVQKQVEATPGTELADRRCMLYAGSTVVAGTVVALVTAVGVDTQTQRAAELAAGDSPAVGLEHQLGELVSRAFPASAGGGVLVSAFGLLRGGGLRQALGDAIAVAVAAVPEGMPLMATLAQHASARRLSRSGALVRVPRSVEALGRLDTVCFDKTGTLSENRLRVTQIHPAASRSDDDVLRVAAQATPPPEGAAHAHATDGAIVEAATAVNDADPAPEPTAHLPFRSGRSFSATLSGTELTVKGAPEVVLAACHDDAGDEAGDTVARLAAEGLRVITVAQRRLTTQQARSIRHAPDDLTELCGIGLTLTGFLGLSDTPRPAAPALLAGLAERDVNIRLITGDHPVTATAIAAQLGMPATEDQVITGAEWNTLSRKQQQRAVTERVIFSRMSPENKVQIVRTLERTGQACAMVGDGANDAAAIRSATVGVGVVAHGSDSAHTVADVVLTEGRTETLLDAVDEGRRLWRGVQAAVSGLLGGNAGEVIFSIIGSALIGHSPLNTRQLLLMNMLTDALPATAVAVSTPLGPAERAGRRGIDETALWRSVAFRGAVTSAAATAAWIMAGFTVRPQHAATVALITLIATELGQTLVDSHAPLVVVTAAGSLAAFMAMITTPGVSQLLGCSPVGPLGWAQGLGMAAAATVAVAAAPRPRNTEDA